MKTVLSTQFNAHPDFDYREHAAVLFKNRHQIQRADAANEIQSITAKIQKANPKADVVKHEFSNYHFTTSEDSAFKIESHEVENGYFIPLAAALYRPQPDVDPLNSQENRKISNDNNGRGPLPAHNDAFVNQINAIDENDDPRKMQNTKLGEFDQFRLDRVRSGGGRNACAATALGAALHILHPKVDPLNTQAVDLIYKNISDDYDKKGPSSPHRIVLEARKHNCKATLIESRGRIFGTLLASFGKMFQRWKQYNSDNAQARVVPDTRGLQRSDFDNNSAVIITVMPASMSGPGHAMLAYRNGSDYFIMDPGTGKAQKFENFEKWAGIKKGILSFLTSWMPRYDKKYGIFLGIAVKVTDETPTIDHPV